jgi:excisionase family DNA binding protein
MDETVTTSRSMAFSVKELAQRIGVSVAFLRLEIGRNHLRATRLGRRVLITHDEAQRYLAVNSK